LAGWPKRPAFKNMDECHLATGFKSEGVIVLEQCPAKGTIKHLGFTYHRVSGTWGWDKETEKSHALYLRDDFGDRLKVVCKLRTAEELGCIPPPQEEIDSKE